MVKSPYSLAVKLDAFVKNCKTDGTVKDSYPRQARHEAYLLYAAMTKIAV